jgi:DNA segregation ATPase FtsK/SpoIIIE, S-DNA-T family
MGQLENDMILGTSAYKNGVRATMFTARDKGVGYLVGGPDPDPRSPACSTSITPPPSG